MKAARKSFLIMVLHWSLAGIFVYAGITKFGSPQNFADSIASFSILPNGIINLLALTLPPFEILLGLAVITGLYRRQALLGLTILTFIFIVALISAIVRGIPVDCGCFGSGSPSAYDPWIALGRDLLILLCSGVLYLREVRSHRDSASFASSSAPKSEFGFNSLGK